MLGWIIGTGLLIGAGMLIAGIYNGLARLRVAAESAWSDIDVQLKKRYDLVPSLVETVKGYAKHERETLDAVISARSQAMAAGNPGDQAKSENFLTGALKSLFALSEAYPDLKANTNFVELQAQFERIEDDIEGARRYYNAVVRDYNTRVDLFPSNIIANLFRFLKREFFELDSPAERNPIKPDFS